MKSTFNKFKPFILSYLINSFKQNGHVTEAILELKKLRENWLDRPDLILRAARHYEGAMQAFIRCAVRTCGEVRLKS